MPKTARTSLNAFQICIKKIRAVSIVKQPTLISIHFQELWGVVKMKTQITRNYFTEVNNFLVKVPGNLIQKGPILQCS